MKYSRSDIAKGFVAQADSKGLTYAIRELAALLLQQRMHSQLDEVIDDIAREFTRVHGVMEANVLTAFPLSTNLKEQLIETVKQRSKAQKVILHETVDQSLLAGVVLQAPDMELDLSLKTKLAKLKA